MFSIQNLSIFAADKALVKNLSFKMQDGQRWAVLGANGCGKSSVLNACAGLHLSGREVHFSNLQIDGFSFTQRGASTAHLSASIAQQLSHVRSVCPQRLDWNTALTPAQLADLLGIVPATNCTLALPTLWLNQPLSYRSGGEQQRIAVALVVGQKTTVCMLDEPLTHLDEVQQVQLLKQLQATGKTILMVSHHIRLSLAWASHLLIPTGDGSWLAGEVADLCNAPAIALAYGISDEHADQLLSGQALFNPAS